MTRHTSLLAIACASAVLAAACDTPPASPVNAGVPAIPPAHASPDPPPGRPVIVEDAGTADAGRVDVAAPDGGAGLGDVDAGAMIDVDGGGAPRGGRLSASSDALVTEIAFAELRALRPTFRTCYTTNPKRMDRGRVVLRATVAADGTVQAIVPRDTQGVSGRIVTCLSNALKSTRFPNRGRESTLDVPLSYRTVY